MKKKSLDMNYSYCNHYKYINNKWSSQIRKALLKIK